MWEQEKEFSLNKMGREPGMCLGNVRKGFGIPSRYYSAKEAMEAAKKAGHLHPMDTRPTNCAVPVFADTTSTYEHVMVYDHDTLYSDGAKVTNPGAFKYFGWSESLNDVRIVKWVEKKKTNEQIADEVIAGKWGNGQERKDRLTAAGYDYWAVQAIVDQKVKGNIKVGDRVRPIKFVDYNGRALLDVAPFYTVFQINGKRVVLKNGNSIYAAVNVNNLRKV